MSEIPFFKAEKIAEKSWQISHAFTKPDSQVFCYLIEGRNYALLIDTMMGFGNLNNFCKTLTKKPVKVVNTHAHWDHICGNFFFDSCYLHNRDIAIFQEATDYTKQEFFVLAKQMALPEYVELLTLDKNFMNAKPIRIFPLYDGDIFDLGDRKIEVVEVAGHTPGSIVLIDHKTRIAYVGDACNSNTLLELPHSLSVATYKKSLLRLLERKSEFDKMYCGHEVVEPSIIDEGIETVDRVLAGTDDHYVASGIFGTPVIYAAARLENCSRRVDGKKFNMSYNPERAFLPDPKKQTIL